MVIIGYLPVDSFEDVKDKDTNARYRTELFHRSLDELLEPLKTASSNGTLAWCADGRLRHIYPSIAAWIADCPEQHNIACTTHSGCSKCMQRWKGRGQGGPNALLRNQRETCEALQGCRLAKNSQTLSRLQLKPVVPFWDGFPHLNIGRALAPDLLHQLYKGMYEHVRNWVENLLGTDEFNRRFVVMPPAQDLRHFKKGVTTVSVWAGRESRDMMRQFLPIIIDAKAPPNFIRLVRALLDFSYLAHSARLTEVELTDMDNALAAFHRAKYILVDRDNKKMGIVQGEGSFDRIIKLHMLAHYTQDIRQLGTPDGYSTETPEHLHIMYVKIPWRMSNRRDRLPQMVGYVRRLEVLEIQRAYIEEYYGEELEFDVRDIVFNDDEEHPVEHKVGDDSEDEEDFDSDDKLEDPVEVELPGRTESEIVYYPRPRTCIAKRPTIPDVPVHVIMSSYGASNFIRALHCFLLTKTTSSDRKVILLPSDRFPVWHKAVLEHSPLPSAPTEQCHRDVVCVHPPVQDVAGRVSKVGVFDTALFATDRSSSGLRRFRAGRVRVIFSLPPDILHLCPEPLVYVDIFSPFSPDITSSHGLFSTRPEYNRASYAALVLPINCLRLACHLAPNFSSPSMSVPLTDSPCKVVQYSRFLFNEHYNHFTFLLTRYWRRVASD